MGALRPFSIGIVLTIVFALFMFLGMITFLEDNNPNAEVLTNGETNATQIISSFNDSLSGFRKLSDDAQSTLQNDTPGASTFLFLIARSMWTIPLSILQVIVGGGTTILSLISLQLFGVGSSVYVYLFMSIIGSIIVFTAILYIISAIRSGGTER